MREVLPRTATDSQILEYAQVNGYLVMTCNRDDFLNLGTGWSREQHQFCMTGGKRSHGLSRSNISVYTSVNFPPWARPVSFAACAMPSNFLAGVAI